MICKVQVQVVSSGSGFFWFCHVLSNVKFRNSLSLRTGAVNKEFQYVTTTFPVPSQDCIGNADMLFGNIEIILSHTEAFAFPHRKCEPWKLNAYQQYWVCSRQKR